MALLHVARLISASPIGAGRKASPIGARRKEKNAMIAIIQRAIDEKGGLAIPARSLSPDADLYGAGLTPFAAVQILLALEEEFRIEFPRQMLNRQSVSSINAIRSRICAVQNPPAQRKAA
jgi:acyl carrier protein